MQSLTLWVYTKKLQLKPDNYYEYRQLISQEH